MAGAFVAATFIFADHLTEKTRRGFPVGLLFAVGAICFVLVAARSWSHPYSED